MGFVSVTTAGGEIHPVGSVREDSNQCGIKIVRLVRRYKDHSGLGNRCGGFGAEIGNNRKATGNSRNRAAAARRDGPANKEKNVASGKLMDYLSRIYDTFHR